jgi:inosine-uridine nucleoside N-ribohydrolase
MTNAPERKLLWCDHDIGHDDSIALLLALYEPSISLMGVSTVSEAGFPIRLALEPLR